MLCVTSGYYDTQSAKWTSFLLEGRNWLFLRLFQQQPDHIIAVTPILGFVPCLDSNQGHRWRANTLTTSLPNRMIWRNGVKCWHSDLIILFIFLQAVWMTLKDPSTRGVCLGTSMGLAQWTTNLWGCQVAHQVRPLWTHGDTSTVCQGGNLSDAIRQTSHLAILKCCHWIHCRLVARKTWFEWCRPMSTTPLLALSITRQSPHKITWKCISHVTDCAVLIGQYETESCGETFVAAYRIQIQINIFLWRDGY